MVFTFTARDLLVATWAVSVGRVQRDLPPSLDPVLTEDGRALVSVAAFRAGDPRLDGRRVASFAQLTVRTYVRHAGEPGIFLFSLRTTLPGLPGIVFGLPLRAARVRVGDGIAAAPGLGVVMRYGREVVPPEVPLVAGGQIGSEHVAFFESAGLRRLSASHDPFAWERAVLDETPRVDPVLALGFDIAAPDSLLYAASTGFRLELPATRIGTGDGP